MDAVEPLKGWSLELAGQEYGAGFLSSIPWPSLRALAQDKVKLLRLQQQQVAQKSLISQLEQEVLVLIQNNPSK
ncbi:MAG: hypothetical protein HN530_05985 [Gammaproteobacteria bacterium]|nr:hypothetical protein [Gammaproteobacteria bacterium]